MTCGEILTRSDYVHPADRVPRHSEPPPKANVERPEVTRPGELGAPPAIKWSSGNGKNKTDAFRRLGRIRTIRERDGDECWLCFQPFTEEDPPTIDHVIPRAHGGSNHVSNLKLAHKRCNNERGSPEP